MACDDRTRSWDVLGSHTRWLAELLRERGYERGHGPGRFVLDGPVDAAPGWGDWIYFLRVDEDPARPVLEELEARLR